MCHIIKYWTESWSYARYWFSIVVIEDMALRSPFCALNSIKLHFDESKQVVFTFLSVKKNYENASINSNIFNSNCKNYGILFDTLFLSSMQIVKALMPKNIGNIIQRIDALSKKRQGSVYFRMISYFEEHLAFTYGQCMQVLNYLCLLPPIIICLFL